MSIALGSFYWRLLQEDHVSDLFRLPCPKKRCTYEYGYVQCSYVFMMIIDKTPSLHFQYFFSFAGKKTKVSQCIKLVTHLSYLLVHKICRQVICYAETN